MDERLANSADLLVKVAAVLTDPSGLSAAALVAGGYLNLKSVIGVGNAHAGCQSRVAKELRARLIDPAEGWPAEADILFPQILDLGCPDARMLVAAELSAETVAQCITDRVSGPDYGEPIKAGFRRWVTPVLSGLLNDPEFVQTLGPAIARETLAALAEIQKKLDRLTKQFGSLSGALENLGALGTANRDLMEALATRFVIPEAYALADGDLRKELDLRAEDYRRMRDELATLALMSERLGNIIPAASAALTDLRLDEADLLLGEARALARQQLEEPLKLNAAIMEQQAALALLRGRVDEAFRILSAAADSFGSIDPLEPARKRFDYAGRLYQHGLRYGGAGLALSAEMRRIAAAAFDVAGDREAWAKAQNALGNALANQGSRSAGAPGADLLGEAVAAFRSALEVITREEMPDDWAMTQNNLGGALLEQGRRSAGEAGADLLGEAVGAFRSALEVYTREAMPDYWAATQNNLGITLWAQGSRSAGAAGAALLREAVATYRSALEVYTREAMPEDWAMTQNNLGSALVDQGVRSAGTAGADLLAKSLAAYRSALQVRTREAIPALWAETQENIAIAELVLAVHDSCTDPCPPLARAIGAVEAALSVYDPGHMAHHYDKATRLHEIILAAQRAFGCSAEEPGL